MTRATLAMVISPIVTGALSPTWDGALWVGEVDRADVHASSHRDVVALEGAAGYRRARLLVRDHGEPLGFVEADITERRRIGGTIDVRALQRAIRPMPAPERRPAAGLVLPSVTVVLCTDGAAGTTMRSVLANEYPDFDVVVVSHGADDGGAATVEIGGRHVTTIAAPTGGLAAARNAGLLAASGEVVAFVAEGAVVDGDWVAALAAAFAADPDVACVTGLVPSAELRTPRSAGTTTAPRPAAPSAVGCSASTTPTTRPRTTPSPPLPTAPVTTSPCTARPRSGSAASTPPSDRAPASVPATTSTSSHDCCSPDPRSPSNRPPSRGSDRRTTSRRSAPLQPRTATDSEPG
ncbi:glycosyltransferase family A protein [Curtobacterium sp. 24E2]|nr:glycosyltransferase [Curtobacterium sp. 24E2]